MLGALAKNGSFGFAKGRLVCRAKPNVPFVRWHFSVYVGSLFLALSLSFRVTANVWRYEMLPIAGDFLSSYTKVEAGFSP